MANKNVTLLVVSLMLLATLQPSTAGLKEDWDACYNKCKEGCTIDWLYYPCIAVCKTKCVPNLNMHQPPPNPYEGMQAHGHGHSMASRKHGHGLPPMSSPTPKSSPTSTKNNS